MRKAPTLLVALVLSSACGTRQPEPYDIDVAYCRRASTPPSTMAATTASYVGIRSGSQVQTQEFATGMSDQQYDACMRNRFHGRFPGVPYPLDR